jgi:hypothetical protein
MPAAKNPMKTARDSAATVTPAVELDEETPEQLKIRKQREKKEKADAATKKKDEDVKAAADQKEDSEKDRKKMKAALEDPTRTREYSRLFFKMQLAVCLPIRQIAPANL